MSPLKNALHVYGQKPVTVMFIGLSGSGKSTLAHALERRLFDMGRVSTVLDGKQMRLGISKDLPHDAEGRAENLRRSAFIAKYLNDAGLICCAAFVSPNLDSREHMISVIGRGKLHGNLPESRLWKFVCSVTQATICC